LQYETRFQTPRLLADHGVKRAINVPIERGGHGKAFFGVLEVDSPDPGRFDQADADFLAGFAGLLGTDRRVKPTEWSALSVRTADSSGQREKASGIHL
jgi:hypothetical protein